MAEQDDKSSNPSQLSDKDLLTRIRKRLPLMEQADHENRVDALADMKFIHLPGWQWDKDVKEARGSRPCYEFNKGRIKAKRIVNEMRANRPAGKVRAVEDSDKPTAEVIEGLGRNILSVCDFDTTADYAGEYQVGGGMGAWRIVTEFDEDSFDQDILVKPIANPFNLFWDPASVDSLHRDAEDWCLIDRMSDSAFERKYGKKARKVDFEAETPFDDEQDWFNEDGVRVCEYHWKEPYQKRLIQLDDGRVLDAADPAAELIPVERIKRTRVSECQRIMMCVASGDAILEGPIPLKGKYHRFVVVHGEWIIIAGKAYWFGGTRHSKDAQRAYNVASTAVTETIATAPNSHFWATSEQAKGNTDMWNRAIAENLPYLLYNADPKAPGPPARMGGADVPIALIQEITIRDQELKDVWGVYDASLGERSNEQSGRAIARRNEQSQIVNFNFPDNMAKAKQWTVTVINDLIPHHYDTDRTVRVIGMDGAEDYVRINAAGIDPQTGEPVIMNDLTRGKYDVTVTVGPSFSTQRQEASEAYTQLAAQDPMLMQVAGDLVYQSLDLPYADQIAERRRAMLPPQLQAIAGKGKQSPEEARAQAMIAGAKQQLDEQGQLVQQAAAEAEQTKAEAEKAQSDTAVKQAQFQVSQAQFDADVAKANAALDKQAAALTKQAADLTLREAQATIETGSQQLTGQHEAFANEVRSVLAEIPAVIAQFIQQAASALAQAQASQPPQVVQVATPVRQRVRSIRRVNGELIPEYEEVAPQGESRVLRIRRENGSLIPEYDDSPRATN